MDAAAHMQQQAALLAADGGNLVADIFRRMEMAGVQTNKNVLPSGIRQIEVGGTDGAAFRADAEKLRFDGVQFVFVTDFLRKAFVQRFQKPLAGGIAVGRSVFVTIWRPEVHDARRAQFLTELRADLAAGLAVVDPELADGGIWMGQRQAMVQFRMRIERGGDVESDLVRLRPIQPAAVVVQRETVAIHAGEHLVHLMGLQTDTMLAGDQLQRHFQIGAQFVRIPCAARIVARHLAAARQGMVRLFKPFDIIALPRVNRNLDGGQRLHGGIRVNTVRRIDFTRQFIHFINRVHIFPPLFMDSITTPGSFLAK